MFNKSLPILMISVSIFFIYHLTASTRLNAPRGGNGASDPLTHDDEITAQ